MKNILLMVHDDAGQESRFKAALDLAQALDGHLVCVDVFVPRVTADPYYRGSGSVWAMGDELTRERTKSASLRDRLANEDVSWNWVKAVGGLSDCVTDEAGLVDVIVSSRQVDRLFDPNLPRVTTDIALANSQPVIAVPEGRSGVDWRGIAMVAWDGSTAATAALRASVPILKLADAVELVEVDERPSGPSAEAAARYLSRYGVIATIARIGSDGRPIDRALNAHVNVTGADYLVMGAYGHNRIRELFFGGVTRSMLRDSVVPLVLAH